jgi:hypothetical protein
VEKNEKGNRPAAARVGGGNVDAEVPRHPVHHQAVLRGAGISPGEGAGGDRAHKWERAEEGDHASRKHHQGLRVKGRACW